jgi:hypothetical protein
MLIIACLAWSDAKSHSWYPPECCSERDCAPAAAGEVAEDAAGFTVRPDGEFVPRGQEKQSPDGAFHVCRSAVNGRLICLFVPVRGS